MIDFFTGAIMMACAACGIFFFKSWRASGDRFFLLFALAFWAMAVERWVIVIVDPAHEMRYYIYTIRLVAFVLICAAIADKNFKDRS